MYERISQQECVIQKYGGTSVGDIHRIKAVAQRVARFHAKGWKKIAIVVSAMSEKQTDLSL